MQEQCAFSPHGALVREAVAAVPSTGGAVTSLIAEGVGIVVATVRDVAWTESNDGDGCREGDTS